MAEGLSAAEAVKAAYIVDTVVWNQVRLLPLVLDKDYMNMQRKLKKLSGKECAELIDEEEVMDDDISENENLLVMKMQEMSPEYSNS